MANKGNNKKKGYDFLVPFVDEKDLKKFERKDKPKKKK